MRKASTKDLIARLENWQPVIAGEFSTLADDLEEAVTGIRELTKEITELQQEINSWWASELQCPGDTWKDSPFPEVWQYAK